MLSDIERPLGLVVLYPNTALSRIDNSKYSDEVVARHGDSAQGVHWNSQKTQQRRFEVLLDFLKLDKYVSLVDVGCGFGALYGYMNDKSVAFKAYLGIEIMASMVEVAQEKGINVCEGDVLSMSLPKADYYLCSGAMNILSREETMLFIQRCLDASERGFVFNLLEGEDESMVYNYFNPEEIEALADELGVKCQIKSGYLERDFTVFLEKKKGNG